MDATSGGVITSITRWVLAHKRLVVAAWLVITVVGIATVGSTINSFSKTFCRTGRLVTSAALILFLAFLSMFSAPVTDVKVFATALAAGIMLDATVIRGLLVPAIVSLFGRWNWWLPPRPAKLLRVEPSLPERVAPAET
jgi:RND superfamily putative drug exporter